MGKPRLKTKIAINLFGLLVLGMLLTDMVVSVLWQKALVSERVAVETANLRNLTNFIQQKEPGNLSTIIFLTQQHFFDQYYNFAYYDRQSLTLVAENSRSTLVDLVKEAANTHSDIIRFEKIGFDGGIPSYRFVNTVVCINKNETVGISLDLQSLYALVRNDHRIILTYVLMNAVLLTVVGFFRFAALVLKPIDKLVDLAETFKANGVVNFLPVKVDNELSTLGLSLTTMLNQIQSDRHDLQNLIASLEEKNFQLLQSQREVIIAEKMAAVGLLAAGIAHEIGNPLSIIQGYIELLTDRETSATDSSQFSEKAMFELERVSNLIRQLLNFARANSKDLKEGSVFDIIIESVESVKIRNFEKSILFFTELNDISTIRVKDSEGFRQVILNCLLNAIDAIEDNSNHDSGKISVCSRLVSSSEINDSFQILISDDGIGMTESQLLSVFDPFFSSKKQGKGTGLGLYVSYAIVEASMGKIWMESLIGKGTTVYIELPAVSTL